MNTSIPQRVCTKCKFAFPETPEFFPKNKNSRCGLLTWCKNCTRVQYRVYDKAHRPNRQRSDRPNDTFKKKHERTEKCCGVCGDTKPLNEFGKDKYKFDGLDHRCKNCIRERSRLRDRRYRDAKGDPNRQKDTPGYIYIVYSIGRYKIGLTTRPQKRIREIQSPYPVDLICIIQTDNMLSLENALHERFDHARKHGEWFELSDEDIEEIKHMA